jgi:hypothetical protein
MVDDVDDNRRRISTELLKEIEGFDGKDFSEQLLKWKSDLDSLSSNELESVVRRVVQQELSDYTEGR